MFDRFACESVKVPPRAPVLFTTSSTNNAITQVWAPWYLSMVTFKRRLLTEIDRTSERHLRLLDEAKVTFTNDDDGIIWLRRILQEEIEHTQRSQVEYLVMVANAIADNMPPVMISGRAAPITMVVNIGDLEAVAHGYMNAQT